MAEKVIEAQHVNSLVPLRGIICLLVFFYHLFCVSNGYFTNEYIFMFFDFVRYGLHIFFIISGFVITHSLISKNYELKHYPKFIAKRLIRIQPTYLVVLAVGLLYFMARNLILTDNGVFDGIDGYKILAHVFYYVDFTDYNWLNIVFWTLAIEFQFYTCYALLFPLIKKYRFILLILMLPSIFFFNMYETALHHIAIFTIGIVMAFYYNKKISLKEFLFYILVSSAVILYVHGLNIFLFTLPVYLIVLNPLRFPSKFLIILGKMSYSLFLVHTITSFSIINIAHRFPKTIYNKIGFTLLAIIVTLVASYVMYKFVEKPTANLSKRIKYK